MKGRFAICVLMLMSLLLAIVASAGAAPPDQEPTPTPLTTQAQADALLEECLARYQRSDFRAALEKRQTALPLYQQLGDQAGEAVTLNNIGMVYHLSSGLPPQPGPPG
jgi:hypothetical protein